MSTTHARKGIRWAAAVALVFAIQQEEAESSGIVAPIEYGTTGTIGSVGITGSPIVSFRGVSDATLTTGGTPFNLGDFVVAPLPEGTSTTYHWTPFQIALTPRAVDGTPTPDAKSVVIEGTLDGTVTGNKVSSLRFDFVRYDFTPENGPPFMTYRPPFQAGKLMNYLFDAPGADYQSAPASTGGVTPVQSVIHSTEVVPEPTSIALFACVASLAVFKRSASNHS